MKDYKGDANERKSRLSTEVQSPAVVKVTSLQNLAEERDSRTMRCLKTVVTLVAAYAGARAFLAVYLAKRFTCEFGSSIFYALTQA